MRRSSSVMRVVVVVVLAAGLLAVTATSVLRSRTERQLQAALDDLGAPAGFRKLEASSTGSIFCFGPCLRRHVRYIGEVSFSDALAQLTAHMRSRGATRSCTFRTDCAAPVVAEDCFVLNDGPHCLMPAVVKGYRIFVEVDRSGPPTELRVTGAPKKDINLFF